ncbi:hypothetical protein KCU77_g10443, partial [Aureobasidium melanogenum]
MATFFYNITEAFTALAISEASAQNTNNEPIINSNFPDYSTSTYDLQGRDIRFQPEPTGPMRPNFIPYSPSTEMIGRFYPSGTSAPVYSLDKVRKLESAGYLRSQVTVGRWRAMCDVCFEDCAEGFWEKKCQIDMQAKQTTSAVRFLGRCNKCGHSFSEDVPGI